MENLAELRTLLAKNEKGMVLEHLAHKYQCSYETVLTCLPETAWQKIDGCHFVNLMQKMASFTEPMTVIFHHLDSIIEVTGKIPNGEIAQGYYNLMHGSESGLHGHLRYVNCQAIYLLDRQFMNRRTVAVNFINKQGECMFKVFVGRDENGNLRPHQIDELTQFFAAQQ